jgi:solute carrier family 9 (sodium/hydrogen exchanger), member 6/7
MSFEDISFMCINFLWLSLCSIAIGLIFGLGCAFVQKHMTDIEKHPVREIFLLMLFAYVSYIASEILGLSGIMTLLCCGLAMSHYAYNNLSSKSKIGSVLAIETIGHAAEAFLFTYLGLSIYGVEKD